jgi:hypothetical protein
MRVIWSGDWRSLTEGQWVALLLILVQRLDLLDQVVRWEVLQLVGRLGVAEDHDEGPVEKLAAVDFDLVCERVPRELRDVSLQIEDVQA